MEYSIVRSGNTKEHLNKYSTFLSSPFLKLNYLDIQRCTVQYLQWQYLENPVGQFIGYDAYYKGQIVSHFATLPVIYSINGKPTKGLLALNLVTHPEHRGKGLFLKIATKTFEDAYSSGYKFVVGVANQNSSHGLINRLGFKLIAPLDVKIGMGKINTYKTNHCKLYPIWTPESLNWRLSNPSARYFQNSKNYIVTPTGKPFIFSQMHFNTSHLPSLKNKNTLFKLWIGLAENKKEKGLFITLPKKLKPVPLNFIFKDLTDKNLTFKKEDVFFELIDFDAY